MTIFMNSPRGKRFLRTCLETIKEGLGGEKSLKIMGGEARIHSFWDVCNDCLSSLKSLCKSIFLPDIELETSLGFSRSASPSYLLNTFSEMRYKGNPDDLTGKPSVLKLKNSETFLIVSSRRKKEFYSSTFSTLLDKCKGIVEKYKTPSTLASRKKRAIESDDELEKQPPLQSLETHTPLSVLKWMGMVLAHPQNKETLFNAGLCDEDITTFCTKALFPDLWGYPFSHHYGWEKWEALKKKKNLKGSHPFLFVQENKTNSTPLPPFLLLSGDRGMDIKSIRKESDLQRKWLNYNPYRYAIPHFGWNEITVIDVEEGVGLTNVGEKAQCQMCGNTQLIHLHHVSHPNSGRHLFVESECVQFMTMKKDEILKSLKRSQKSLDQTLSSQSEERSRKRKKLVRSPESQEKNLLENEDETGTQETLEIILSLIDEDSSNASAATD
ncbi:MAG: hypothetical protein B7Y25_03605 [Alphaproteobacteria bacterium 16-39-46]|nr:MAG: hypothetical protein B7Y25_03605 [Alphaproteobacteria bacterium 16-39-46]OZA43190.1 MAG: hypothetical protein B7X84_03830 [Alphaproteobacteria bacterium 17-39-52]HQS84074.1 hypothetical protein [Alphaproteobacteria bacterium]HQS94515.1 hypothetical protein [Alphaproteobacteria bacterium]